MGVNQGRPEVSMLARSAKVVQTPKETGTQAVDLLSIESEETESSSRHQTLKGEH
jgi:hypothetical protein